MIGLIELSNCVVETVSSKCITPSQTEGEGKVKVKMYRKCMEIFFSNVFFSMIPPSDVNLMYNKVVELVEFYLIAKGYF